MNPLTFQPNGPAHLGDTRCNCGGTVSSATAPPSRNKKYPSAKKTSRQQRSRNQRRVVVPPVPQKAFQSAAWVRRAGAFDVSTERQQDGRIDSRSRPDAPPSLIAVTVRAWEMWHSTFPGSVRRARLLRPPNTCRQKMFPSFSLK